MQAEILTPGRDSDVLVHERVFGCPVLMMGVSRDAECGEWLICPDCEQGPDKEVQAIQQRLGIKPHAHHEDEQPCYRESPDGAVSVVPEYTTDFSAIALVLDKWRSNHLSFRLGYDSPVVLHSEPPSYSCQVFNNAGATLALALGCMDLSVAVSSAAVTAAAR